MQTLTLFVFSLAFCLGQALQQVRLSKLPASARVRAVRQVVNGNTTEVEDFHVYYNSTFYPPGEQADSLWLDLVDAEKLGGGLVTTLDINDSFLEWKIPFLFPFYGHYIDTVHISKQGFLYTGPYLHPFTHLSEYIAALQANFNLSLGNESRILLFQTNDRLTILWNKLYNQDHVEDGPFTFQMSLFPSGVIHFVYREIPVPVSELNTTYFPAEIGLSDSLYDFYYVRVNGESVLFLDIYIYHEVSLNVSDDVQNSAYVLTPLPNCVQAETCQECTNLSQTSNFECAWCESLQLCSDGIDRYRPFWTEAGCPFTAVLDCRGITPTPTTASLPLSRSAIAGIAVGGVVVLIIVLIVALLTAVFCYGYCNPNTKIGLFLIAHRPKARYINKEPTVSSDGEKVNFG